MSSFNLLLPPIASSIPLSSLSQTQGTPLSLPSPTHLGGSCSSFMVYCGRGDKKTAKGKRFNHSFGNARPGDKNKGRGPPRIPVPSSPSTQPQKRDKFEDDEVVKIDIDDSLL